MARSIENREVNPQRVARTFGVLFLLTWVTAIAARVLFDPAYTNPAYIIGAGSDTRVQLGAVFEFLLIVANIGTAVVLYPIAKRQSEIGALGYVTARIMESAFIMVGILSLLSIVGLRQDLGGVSGTDAAALEATGRSLATVYEFAFLFGPGLIAGVGNGLILGWLMYSSGLVPRRMAMLGLIGGPLLVVGFVGMLFGAFEAGSAPQFLITATEMAWEGALPIYLMWKGFKPTAVVPLDDRAPAVEPSMAAV
jgi:hypothetical protein